MVAWQRGARLMTVAVGLTVSVAVFVTSRRREPPPVPQSIPRMDPAAVIESSGAFVRDVKGNRERFRVEAERQLTYSDGQTKLMGVKVSVDREGKTFVITGDEAQVGDNQSSVQLNGKVRLVGSDGLTMNAASASYSEGEGIVRAPGPVTFSRGSMTGKGVDFTYDRERDQIGLSDQTSIQIAPDKKDAAGANITAGASLLARKDKFMTFERSVHIIRGSQVIDADRAVADLTEDEKNISALDLNGNSRITKPDAAPGGVTAMLATNISITYAPNSELIQHAVLAGGSTVKLAAEKKGNLEKTLVADALEFGLAPDGATVTSLNAHDKVSLDLPAPRGQTSKNVRSNTFVASGDEKQGLTTAVFSDGVEYRETGGTPPVQRLVRSRTLDAALGGGLGEIRDARFLGNVQFNDGSTQATAADVRYQTESGQVALSGKIGNADPHVTTDQMVVDAVKIDMTLDGPKMQATDAVRAVMQPAKPGTNAKDARKMPGLMKQDRPVYAWSTALAYDGGAAGKADFTGQVRLTQGDTFVKGDHIIVETETGNLTANGAVTSQFLVDQMNDTTKQKETTRATGGGAEMRYDDAARRVGYKTAAYLNGPQGAIKAGSVSLFLSKVGNDVDRLEADTAVTLTETNRVTTGDKLIYISQDESYVMSGKPAQMIDKGCKFNKGSSLSFSKTTDQLRIEGNDDTRSETKTEGKCIEPRTN